MRERGERTSIGQQLDEAAQALEHAGVLNARREATALWAALEGVKLGDVWLKRDAPPASSTALRSFWEAVRLRSSGMPFPYAVGRTGFRTLNLKIDRRALIPRPETEGLVGLVLEWARSGRGNGGGAGRNGAQRWGWAADIGTGCGCIALSLAVEGQFDRVVAVDRFPEALALARENLALLTPPPAVTVEFRQGDVLEPLAGERYRVIVANPPYLTEAEYEALDPAVKAFEPPEALVSGHDGLDATRRIFAEGAALLDKGGMLAVEIDARRVEQVVGLAYEFRWARIAIHDDLFHQPRYALAFAREEA